MMSSKNEIRIIYGDRPGPMVKELLGSMKIEDEIDKNALIGIKPNLVVAKPASSGATTSPELVAGIIEYLRSKGLRNIVSLEGSWVGDRTSLAFEVCGYQALSSRYGVPLIDLQQDSHREFEFDGLRIPVCESVTKLGYLINVPVLKGHCQTNLTCALKNLKGCIPNFEKRKFHAMGLHKPIAYLNKILKQDLIIVDGLAGDLDFEEGGNPVRMNRILAGKDPVLMDAYAARLIGFGPDEVPYIRMAEKIGVGTADLANARIIELNKDSGGEPVLSSRKAQRLARYIRADSACSACYGSLIHALKRRSERGELDRLKTEIHIGQGFKGKELDGLGIGACTAKFRQSVAGCPPTAKDILEFLERNL